MLSLQERSAMYELFIGNKNYSSWSLRPWVLMTELGIPFQEHLLPFGSPEWTQFDAVLPAGKVPTLKHGEMSVWDSLGIIEYLAERHEAVWPEEPDARAWARCAAAEMHSGFSALRNVCSMNCGVRVKLADIEEPLAADIARIDALWKEGLTRFGGPYLAGTHFTAVDAFYAPVVFRVRTYGLALDPACKAYMETMLGLSSMQAWSDAGIAEPWRDAAHEADLRQAGTIISDNRA